MSITDATLLTLSLSLVLQVVVIVFLGWLYRATRLKPVLYNLGWHVFSLAWTPVSRLLNAKALVITRGQTPVYSVPVLAASELMAVLGTLFLLWMLAALVQWGRPGLFQGQNTVTPNPAGSGGGRG